MARYTIETKQISGQWLESSAREYQATSRAQAIERARTEQAICKAPKRAVDRKTGEVLATFGAPEEATCEVEARRMVYGFRDESGKIETVTADILQVIVYQPANGIRAVAMVAERRVEGDYAKARAILRRHLKAHGFPTKFVSETEVYSGNVYR